MDFIPRFFGLNHEEFSELVRFDPTDVVVDQDGNESDENGVRRPRKGGLIRSIFAKRNGTLDSAMNSKESTPMPTTEHDMEIDDEATSSDSEERPLPAWINVAYVSDASIFAGTSRRRAWCRRSR